MIETSIRPCPLSDLYHILSAPRRCCVIQLLDEDKNDKHTVRELSQEIAAFEHDISQNNATGEPYRNVYNALSQTHLRTMANLELIEYDQRRQCVRPNQDLRLAALILEYNHFSYFMYENLINDHNPV